MEKLTHTIKNIKRVRLIASCIVLSLVIIFGGLFAIHHLQFTSLVKGVESIQVELFQEALNQAGIVSRTRNNGEDLYVRARNIGDARTVILSVVLEGD